MRAFLTFAVAMLLSASAWAQQDTYKLQPGDMLDISIWGDEGMRRQVVVLPDGKISYPLVGHLAVAGMSPKQAENALKSGLVKGKFYVDPPLTVSVVEARGNEVFVIGRVRNGGSISATRRLDVLQALSLAGGPDEFAHTAAIVVLRRDGESEKVFPFNYDAVRKGKGLSSNIMLQPGDVVIVPEVGLFTGFSELLPARLAFD